MQRTYRSKKHMPGALDHKDVIFSIDEKTPMFDAFSIQNIKQTKREFSSVRSSNQYNGSKRVRKRKLVKKLVNDAEPKLRESLENQSTYLTPDKSLRVNKAPDLFDQLFNSLSPQNVDKITELYQTCEVQSKEIVTKNRVYTRKRDKKRVIKKYNYSSSDYTDSEKENNRSNESDIMQHEFVIEKKLSNPVVMEDSIEQIINNASLLKSQPYKNNRLTLSIPSPSSEASPLCSTPLTKKLRGKSIYNKFSPIACNKLNVSEDEKGDENPFENSPILNESNGVEYTSKAVTSDDNVKEGNAACSLVNGIDVINVDKDPPEKPMSATQCSEQSLFYGFSNEPKCEAEDLEVLPSFLNDTNTNRKSIILHCSTQISKKNISNSNYSPNDSELCKDVTIDRDITQTNESIELSTQDQEPFLGFSESTIANVHQNKINEDNSIEEQSSFSTNDDSIIENTIMEGEVSDKLLLGISRAKTDFSVHSLKSQDCNNADDNSDFESESRSYVNKSSDSELSDESKYNTCDSDSDESSNSFKPCSDRQLNVVLDKMDDNIFQEYYLKYSKCCPDVNSIENDNLNNNDMNGSSSEDVEVLSNEEDEPHISFVTTRRRHDVTKEFPVILDNSSSSLDSSKGNLSLVENVCLENIDEEKIASEVNDKPDKNDTTYESAVKQTQESSVTFANISIKAEDPKPAIVLKPGKKWERSLSIYRRMTLMNAESDTSMLDDEDSRFRRGRRYRDSIIGTMEMQDRGPLHNESNISCRNAYSVYRPSRSTVRISKENCSSRFSRHSMIDGAHELTEFLAEDCDDTLVELSKLSIADDPEVTVIEKVSNDPPDRAPTARDYVLRRCNQLDVLQFTECYPDPELKNCHKIGEGVYGEVFLWRARDGYARVMKVVPVAGSVKVNGEQQKDFHEIISEIVIAMELSALRSPIADIERHFDEEKNTEALVLSVENATDVFNEVLAVRCVQGQYPSRLLDLWELYDECKGSENDHPGELPTNQQYIVLELANAGQDLESYQFNSAEQAYALFLQIAFALAVGEEAFQFEHRDFHWGNVLIAQTEQKYATFVLRGRVHRLPRRGVAATIIDYSLSRLSLPLGAGERVALYNDLATDDGLFDAVGDYQFEVYRLMRDKLMNNWKTFEPYTNVLWLHYTVDKMISALRYKRVNTKIHKHYISKLKGIKNRLLEYESAVQFVLNDNEF